jgi:2,2-dialkylglycine decarboxylase (pyruvate)
VVHASDYDTLHRAVEDHLIRYGGAFYERIIERAAGSYVYDDTGRAILDFTSGQMCATLGHNHPAVLAAIREACEEEPLHLFSGMIGASVAALARELAALLPPSLQKAMFLSTGGEANEAALAMAKLATGGFEVVGLTGSWHGMSAGTRSSTYVDGHRGYGPAMPGTLALPAPNAFRCFRCPVRHCRDRCDLICLEVGMALVDQQSVGAPAAVIAEPVQSSGGVIVPPAGYFVRLKELCRERGMLMILDEAQTAFGRLGRMFAFEDLGVEPDILSLSKTLGGGLPLSATVTGAEIERTCHERGFLYYTSHLSDPLPAAVGRAVLRTVVADRLGERAVEMGAYLSDGLRALQQRYEPIGEVRGRGLLIGVELVKDRESRAADHALGLRVVRRCLELGLSMNIRNAPTAGAIWRIAPPLTVSRAEIDSALAIIDQALREALG